MPQSSRHRSLAHRLEPADNSFHLIRLVAAAAVLFSHAWPTLGGHTAPEPLSVLTGHSLGWHAVNVFFVLSGLLVSASAARAASVWDFAAARALRIYPGLVVCAVFTAFVVGPIVTDLGLTDYLAHARVWRYPPATVLLPEGLRPLPGMFETAPFAAVPNVPLWTLRYEILCYAGLAALLIAGLVRQRVLLALFAIATLAYASRLHAMQGKDDDLVNLLRFVFAFATGAALHAVSAGICRRALAILATAGLVLGMVGWHAIEAPGWALFFGAGSLACGWPRWQGFVPWLRRNDLSYGIYIYGFVMLQVAYWLGGRTPAALLAFAVPATLALAYLSWTYVERPALQLKRRINAVRMSALVRTLPRRRKPD